MLPAKCSRGVEKGGATRRQATTGSLNFEQLLVCNKLQQCNTHTDTHKESKAECAATSSSAAAAEEVVATTATAATTTCPTRHAKQLAASVAATVAAKIVVSVGAAPATATAAAVAVAACHPVASHRPRRNTTRRRRTM